MVHLDYLTQLHYQFFIAASKAIDAWVNGRAYCCNALLLTSTICESLGAHCLQDSVIFYVMGAVTKSFATHSLCGSLFGGISGVNCSRLLAKNPYQLNKNVNNTKFVIGHTVLKLMMPHVIHQKS